MFDSAHEHDAAVRSGASAVLVSGGTGLLGRALVGQLAQQGHRVGLLVRRRLEARPDLVAWDPLAGVARPRELESYDALVHLAGESVGAGRWSAARKRRIHESRVRATRLLTEQIARLERRPPIFLCASATGFYGDRGEEILHEESPPGEGFLARLCQEWEEATTPAREAGVRVVNLRFGLVLARGGMLGRVVPLFRWGLGGRLGSGRQYMSWISHEDAIGACLHALRTGSLEGPLNVVAPEPVTNRLFARTLGKVLRRPAALPAPAWALRAVLGELGDEILASQRAIPQRLAASGFPFRHPDLEGALRRALGLQP